MHIHIYCIYMCVDMYTRIYYRCMSIYIHMYVCTETYVVTIIYFSHVFTYKWYVYVCILYSTIYYVCNYTLLLGLFLKINRHDLTNKSTLKISAKLQSLTYIILNFIYTICIPATSNLSLITVLENNAMFPMCEVIFAALHKLSTRSKDRSELSVISPIISHHIKVTQLNSSFLSPKIGLNVFTKLWH